MLTTQLDQTRRELSPKLDPRRRAKLGQFMTPENIAAFMAAKFDKLPQRIRLVDAGAGMGALTAAFVTHALAQPNPPQSIDVDTYEVDGQLAEILSHTLQACARACEGTGTEFTFRIIQDDYILRSAEPLFDEHKTYNCAILNPPYGKINVNSNWRQALRTLGIETVNLYSAFVAVAIQQLEQGGQLVAITPRSFCNGSYFETFRRTMLASTALLSLHVYESRRKAFKDDEVLQENVIFSVRKGTAQNGVELSTDLTAAREVAFSEIVRPTDRHSFIRLPITDNDLADRIQSLSCTLDDLAVKVSTGRVVDFRAKEHLRKMPGPDTVPLIYPAHFDGGTVGGPIDNFKKFNALADNANTSSLIVPEGIYVLTKRFSAKEEKRRLVAAVYEGGRVGFENHLNYFHDNGQGLSKSFAVGLAAFLNSEAVDEYFRIFSGHTQVNATDLRNLHYPTYEQLCELAEAEDADAALEKLF